jgi:two-component system response regulator MprA
VWVVDDDDSYRDLLGVVLETHCGVRSVRAFGCGEDAVHELCALTPAGRPDGLLLDFHMPRMNGLAVLRALRSAGTQLPVLVLSGAATSQDRAACASEGALSFIQKPVRIEELIRELTLWRNALPQGHSVAPARQAPSS